MTFLTKYRHIFITLSLLVILSSCTTYWFQPVKKQIIGKWIAEPLTNPAKPDEFIFNSDGTCSIYFNSNAFYSTPDDTILNAPYSIEHKLIYDYVIIDALATHLGFKTDQLRWIIVKVNSSELYLESQILYDPAQIGFIQIQFTKE